MAKTSSVAMFGGSGTAILSASPPELLGLTPGEWQILGIAGGLILGLLGFFLNLGFKFLHYQLAKRQGLAKEAD